MKAYKLHIQKDGSTYEGFYLVNLGVTKSIRFDRDEFTKHITACKNVDSYELVPDIAIPATLREFLEAEERFNELIKTIQLNYNKDE